MSRPTPSSIARQLIECMVPSRVEEFNVLTSELTQHNPVYRQTVSELIEIASGDEVQHRIRAIELLGVLRVNAAEPVLADVFRRHFSPERLAHLATQRGRMSDDSILLVRLLTALFLLDWEKWKPQAEAVAQKFTNSWIEASLLASIDTIRNRLGGSIWTQFDDT